MLFSLSLGLCKQLWRVGKQHHAVEAIINWNWWYVWTERAENFERGKRNKKRERIFIDFCSRFLRLFWSRRRGLRDVNFLVSSSKESERETSESIFMFGCTFPQNNSIFLLAAIFWWEINNKNRFAGFSFSFLIINIESLWAFRWARKGIRFIKSFFSRTTA